MVTNSFAMQSGATAVCGRNAVLPGRLFIEEGSVEGLLKRLRRVFGEDTLANNQKVLDLVPLTTGGGPENFKLKRSRLRHVVSKPLSRQSMVAFLRSEASRNA